MRCANYGGSEANPENQEGELAFIGKKGELGGAVITKVSIGGSLASKV